MVDCPKCNGIALDNEASEDEEEMIIDRTCEDCGFEFTVYYKFTKWIKGKHFPKSKYEIRIR